MRAAIILTWLNGIDLFQERKLLMKTCLNRLALIALFGVVAPLMASPVEVAEDNKPVESVELDESEGGWVFGSAVGLDFCSKQLTYGLVDNPHAIMTPSLELSWSHDDYFTIAIGAEGIFDMTNYGAKDGGYNDRRWKYQEFDPYITLSKSWDLNDDTALVTELGYIYEYHPRSCNKPAQDYSNPDTQWLTFAIGLEDNFLNPTFTVEYQLARQGAEGETDGKGGIYATFELSHEFDIGTQMGMEEGALCLTPVVGIGMANKDRNMADFEANDSFMFRDAFASIELAYMPVEGLSIAPYIGCHQQIDSKAEDAAGDDDFVAYAGIGVSYEF